MPKPWDKPTPGKSYGAPDQAKRARRSAVSPRKPQVESKMSLTLRRDLSAVMPGSLWWKNAGGEFSASGLPDVMGCYRGQLIAIEVKRDQNWFSPLQVAFLRNAERSGAVAVGLTRIKNEWFIIPTTAMGTKGNRHRELWVPIEYPGGLENVTHWRSRLS